MSVPMQSCEEENGIEDCTKKQDDVQGAVSVMQCFVCTPVQIPWVMQILCTAFDAMALVSLPYACVYSSGTTVLKIIFSSGSWYQSLAKYIPLRDDLTSTTGNGQLLELNTLWWDGFGHISSYDLFISPFSFLSFLQDLATFFCCTPWEGIAQFGEAAQQQKSSSNQQIFPQKQIFICVNES